MKYSKYHALGNDYLVIAPQDLAFELTPEKLSAFAIETLELAQTEFCLVRYDPMMQDLDCGFLTRMAVRQRRAETD